MSYSARFVNRVLSYARGNTQAKAARKYGVGLTTVQKWARIARESVDAGKGEHNGGTKGRDSGSYYINKLQDENRRLKIMVAQSILEKNGLSGLEIR